MQVTNSFITLWKGELNDRGFYKGQISDSRKDKEGNYVNSYYNISAVGDVAKFLASLPERTRLTVKNGRLTNETYTKKDGTKGSYPELFIFKLDDIELSDSSAKQEAPKKEEPPHRAKPKKQEDSDDALPF